MMISALLFFLLLSPSVEVVSAATGLDRGLTVDTKTGKYLGIVNGTTPHVRQFPSVPYALPPVGDRRWLPPAPVNTTSRDIIDATQFPPSCPQFASNGASVWSRDGITLVS